MSVFIISIHFNLLGSHHHLLLVWSPSSIPYSVSWAAYRTFEYTHWPICRRRSRNSIVEYVSVACMSQLGTWPVALLDRLTPETRIALAAAPAACLYLLSSGICTHCQWRVLASSCPDWLQYAASYPLFGKWQTEDGTSVHVLFAWCFGLSVSSSISSISSHGITAFAFQDFEHALVLSFVFSIPISFSYGQFVFAGIFMLGLLHWKVVMSFACSCPQLLRSVCFWKCVGIPCFSRLVWCIYGSLPAHQQQIRR